jgi:hypothetical protein
MEQSEELGILVQHFSTIYKASGSWSSFIRNVCGRPCLANEIDNLLHPAAPELLQKLCDDGVPVEFTTIKWDQARLESAREWGSHASAFKNLGFVEHEMCDFCNKGFWVILLYKLVKHIPGLRLSLLGVVP